MFSFTSLFWYGLSYFHLLPSRKIYMIREYIYILTVQPVTIPSGWTVISKKSHDLFTHMHQILRSLCEPKIHLFKCWFDIRWQRTSTPKHTHQLNNSTNKLLSSSVIYTKSVHKILTRSQKIWFKYTSVSSQRRLSSSI